MNTAKLEMKAQSDGRIAYTLAGITTVYDIRDAVELMQTGAFRIHCPITRKAMETA